MCSNCGFSGCSNCNGLTIPQGPTGPNGLNGKNAFTVTTASYVQPAVNVTVNVAVDNVNNQNTGLWAAPGQLIFIQNGGYYEVVSATATQLVVMYTAPYATFNQSLTPVGNNVATAGRVSPAGIIGLTGDTGADGVRGSLWYSSALAGPVPVVPGQLDNDLYLDTATGNVYQLQLGVWTLTGNIKGTPGAPGAAGTDGKNAFTVTTAIYVQPTTGNNVVIPVSNAALFTGSWAATGQLIFVENGGYYFVVSSTTTSITAMYTADYATFNQSLTPAGGNVASAGGVSPGGLIGIAASSSVNVARVVYVSTAGDDGTALPERLDLPFLTLDAARTAAATLVPTASNRVLIKVLPGFYSGAGNFILLQDYIDWDLGVATIEFTGTNPVLYDNGITVDSSVIGDGVLQRNSNDSTSFATVELTGVTLIGTRALRITCNKITSAVDNAVEIATAIPVYLNANMSSSAGRALQIAHNLFERDHIYGKISNSAPNAIGNEALFINGGSANIYADIYSANNVAVEAAGTGSRFVGCHIKSGRAGSPVITVSDTGANQMFNGVMIVSTGGGASFNTDTGGPGGQVTIAGSSCANTVENAVNITLVGGTLVVDASIT